MLIELSRQLDLLAQMPDINGDLLVLIVMAILWLVGGLAKVLTSKKGAGQQSRQRQETASKPPAQRESWQQRLARKAREIQEAAEAERRTIEQQTRAQTQTPQPRPAGTITVRTDDKGDSVMTYQPPAADQQRQAARQREARQSVRAASREIKAEPSQPLQPLAVPAEPPTHTAQTPYPQILNDLALSDPDALRTAILHYEILGKPLGLRDSPDDVSRF